MKDSSVGPAGLFNLRRQKRLLDGLSSRFQDCLNQRQALQEKHAQERADEETQLSGQRSEVTVQCRNRRREMLRDWDQAEETLTSQYERTTVGHRSELTRLTRVFRRKADEEKKAIDRKVDARCQAVMQQYENRKNQPGQQKRKEFKLIEDSLRSIHEKLEWSRALTVRRLDRLPQVMPAEHGDQDHPRSPESVAQTLESISLLTRKCKNVVEEMQTGAASKIVDSFYLPIGVAIFIVIWAAIAFFVAPAPPYLWMAAGIIPAGIIGFTVYLILLWPLKKMTRELYPKVERIGQAAEECAVAGRKFSSKVAADASAELVGRRDAHLQSAKRWKKDQLAELEIKLKKEEAAMKEKLLREIEAAAKDYTEKLASVGSQMRAKADSVANKITQQLAATDQTLQQQREAATVRRATQLQHLANRLKAGVGLGIERIRRSQMVVDERFPDWSEVLAAETTTDPQLDFLSIGSLKVDERLRCLLNQEPESPAAAPSPQGVPADSPLMELLPTLLADTEIPRSLPVVMHRRMRSCLVLRCSPAMLESAVELAHQTLWRLLCGVLPSRAKLTLIDPLGRGQHFTSFMALADHDPSLVGHRVWTTEDKIATRLGELAQHVEDVLQASLRDRFERIEDYNKLAGSMAEPYRAVAAVGFPDGLSRDSYGHLRAIIESGLRCGIFTILVCDDTKPWPSDMPLPSGDKVLQIQLDDQGSWTLNASGLESLPFVPAPAPPISLRKNLVEKIGIAAVAASRVEIPLDNILSTSTESKGSTADGISIAIGSQGANRSLKLELGEGVCQHVLIAGKTGSGKSTLLHSIITSGAYHYRPDQLHYYLLDFKKGVEFKSYADTGLPHARVIGIESEREFGRSVLQRLDAELQQRGEKFRDAGVQELAHYRDASGKTMPRVMLIVDEFQELFVRDDRLAGDCAMLLDRLVRQGRSFGMHVVLSSQSLAGAYSLPRATLGQMAVRIAMQCSEADAALILSDDNTAARLISRPGEAIYNNAGGLVEGNQPFQVAWLTSKRHREMLSAISARDADYGRQLAPPVIFEGNRPCHWAPVLADAVATAAGGNALSGLLGESVEIGPPVSLELSRNTGRNVLLIAPADSRVSVLASAITGIAKSNQQAEVVYFDGSRVDEGESLAPWLTDAGMTVKIIKQRDSESEIVRLSNLVKQRGDDSSDMAPILVIVDPLERFRDLRQDDSFNFSLDAPGGGGGGGTALQSVLRDGPPANVFVFAVCGSAETLSRWLPRASQHDLELRILGQMNQSDSAMLIDSPMASELSAATMLLYDDADGRVVKFRQCDLPEPAAVKEWLG